MITNIEEYLDYDNSFRHILYTDEENNYQIVIMTVKKEIGLETHNETTQIIKIEKGEGIAYIDGKKFQLSTGSFLTINPGQQHNIINNGKTPLKLYTIYIGKILHH